MAAETRPCRRPRSWCRIHRPIVLDHHHHHHRQYRWTESVAVVRPRLPSSFADPVAASSPVARLNCFRHELDGGGGGDGGEFGAPPPRPRPRPRRLTSPSTEPTVCLPRCFQLSLCVQMVKVFFFLIIVCLCSVTKGGM